LRGVKKKEKKETCLIGWILEQSMMILANMTIMKVVINFPYCFTIYIHLLCGSCRSFAQPLNLFISPEE